MRLRLFEAFGVELEYMIVSEDRLDVLPICDKVLEAVAGEITSDVEVGDVAWSNELVAHVIELKTNGPKANLSGLPALFDQSIARIEGILHPLGGRLLPGGMHPWMDPRRETHIWPHEYHVVYETFNRIFGCSGHGWANLQSTHLNLPFGDEEEFVRLHAAIRLLLPILPGLAASTPVMDGRFSGVADNRLEVYRTNQSRLPEATGSVVPEAVNSIEEYHERILKPLYLAIAPFDPEKVLQHEWLNSRGAIARFNRNAIEIRVLDIQECPRADLAILSLVIATLSELTQEAWGDWRSQNGFALERLAGLFRSAVLYAEEFIVEDDEYLRALGLDYATSLPIGGIWRDLNRRLLPRYADLLGPFQPELAVVLEQGSLSTRIRKALSARPSKGELQELWLRLADGLRAGTMFTP